MSGVRLSWQTGYSLSHKPRRRTQPRRAKRLASNGTQSFEFVEESPAVAEGSASLKPDHATAKPIPSQTRSDDRNDDARALSVHSGASPADSILWVHEDERALIPLQRPDKTEMKLAPSSLCRALDACNDCSDSYRSITQDCLPELPSAESILSFDFQIPQGIRYETLFDRLAPVLERYDLEFCKIPLTHSLATNPFSCGAELDPQRAFLVHAVLALAGHHVASSETENHRLTALHALRKRLGSDKLVTRDVSSLIDTIVVIFSLDEAQSALGNWSTHLIGALSLLEMIGGPAALAVSPRIQVQAGILTWWDAIISLLARDAPIFPSRYFGAVSSIDNEQGWDFFGLCGCPTELVRSVMQLSRLFTKNEKPISEKDASFQSHVISQIQAELDSWQHRPPEYIRPYDEESMQRDQDKMHISEAWRHGILLYIYRVFTWKPGDSPPIQVLYRARTVVDHVLACREEGMVGKQALLPLFFAACELRDRPLRQRILDFCAIWDARTRYHVFQSGTLLLQNVWAEQERSGFDSVWWGQIVDQIHQSSEGQPLQQRLCFG